MLTLFSFSVAKAYLRDHGSRIKETLVVNYLKKKKKKDESAVTPYSFINLSPLY